MKRAISCMLALMFMAVTFTASGCCENRALREGLMRYSGAMDLSGQWMAKKKVINPKALAKKADGTIDMAACIEAAKMKDLVEQGFPLMASSLREWAAGKDVVVPARKKVDYKAQCQ